MCPVFSAFMFKLRLGIGDLQLLFFYMPDAVCRSITHYVAIASKALIDKIRHPLHCTSYRRRIDQMVRSLKP